MSWNVYLTDSRDGLCKVDTHEEGGTYALGGTDRAELNITYNYSPWYRCYLHPDSGLAWLDGKQASAVADVLRNAIAKLGTKRSRDYWACTKGNAGYALSILLRWAEQHPGAYFEVH